MVLEIGPDLDSVLEAITLPYISQLRDRTLDRTDCTLGSTTEKDLCIFVLATAAHADRGYGHVIVVIK